MLISFEEIKKQLLLKNIVINGSFHVGAHECEELTFYNQLGLTPEDIVWIDAIPSKVLEATNRGIPNVYNVVVTDTDDEEVIFKISNNVQSSSVLDFGTHSYEHPNVVYVSEIKQQSITVDSFFERQSGIFHNLQKNCAALA